MFSFNSLFLVFIAIKSGNEAALNSDKAWERISS